MKYVLMILALTNFLHMTAQNKRARDYGIIIGILNPGKNNAITDVPGVKVGHVTLIKSDSVNTGVTATSFRKYFPEQSACCHVYRQRIR